MKRDRVKDVIETKINPILLEHEGWIELVQIEGKDVTIRFRGACSGCDANVATMEETIKPILLKEIPQIQNIKISNEVSQLLYDMARSMLTK